MLRLRGRAMPGQRVQWTEETVDNEGLNRKKSKSASDPLPGDDWQADAHVYSLLHLPQAQGVRRVFGRIKRRRLGLFGRLAGQP